MGFWMNRIHLLHSFMHDSDIQGSSTRIVSTPCFPLSAPSQWWPTLINVFWVQHDKGEYITFCHGGVLS